MSEGGSLMFDDTLLDAPASDPLAMLAVGVEDRFSHLDIMPLVGPNPSRASPPLG